MKVKRMVEVEEEGQFVVVNQDEMILADDCEDSYEAAIVALLLSMQHEHAELRLHAAFRYDAQVDRIGPVLDVDEERFWINGKEYLQSDDPNPHWSMMWLCRAGISEKAKTEGGKVPDGLWSGDCDRMIQQRVIAIAAKHDLTDALPVETRVLPDDTGSGDRYHVALLLDMIRNGGMVLDPSEKKGLADTIARLAENAGIFPDD